MRFELQLSVSTLAGTTIGAHPIKIHTPPKYPILRRLSDLLQRRRGLVHPHVRNPPALNAPDMLMLFGGGIKAHLVTRSFQPQYPPLRRQQVEITVHRPKTDAGQPPAHHLVQLIRSRVRCDGLKLLQND
jgi:hypothetical protein